MPTTESHLISLMSHTLGSIGQVIKDQKISGVSNKKALREIARIYEGYINKISSIPL